MKHHILSMFGCTALVTLSGCGLMKPAETGAGMPLAGQVQQAQVALQQQATYNGPVDGVAGPATQEAIRLYQQSHDLAVSGELDAPTRRSMDLDATATAELPHTLMADGSRMTEGDARKLIESQGFAQVADLYRDDSAVWRGTASRGGKEMDVAIDASGKVVTN